MCKTHGFAKFQNILKLEIQPILETHYMVLKKIGVTPSAPFAPSLTNAPVNTEHKWHRHFVVKSEEVYILHSCLVTTTNTTCNCMGAFIKYIDKIFHLLPHSLTSLLH